MNREKMLRRLEAGYDPIIVSIEKWEDVKRGDAGFGSGAHNCALCETYKNEPCKNCPLYKINEGCVQKRNSAFYRALRNDDPQIMIDALLRAKKWQDEQKCRKIKEKEKKPVTYSRGQRFLHDDKDEYILAIVNYELRAVLICLNNGNRWNNGTEVEDPGKITSDEFKKLSRTTKNKQFTLIKKKGK